MCALLANALPAMATEPQYRFEMERLTMTPTSESSLLTAAGSVLEPGTLRMALAGHYEREPLTVWRGGERLGSLVRDRLSLQLSGAFAVSRVELGFELPMVAHQGGDALDASGQPVPAARGFGSPRLRARVGLLGERWGSALDMAADLEVEPPLGGANLLASDGGWSAVARLSAGKRLGPVLLALEGGVRMRRELQVGSSSIGSELPLMATLASTGSGVRAELSFQTAIPLMSAPLPMQVLGGVRCPVSSGLELFALSGIGLGSAPGIPSYRVLTGVSFTPMGPRQNASFMHSPPVPVALTAPPPPPASAPPVELPPSAPVLAPPVASAPPAMVSVSAPSAPQGCGIQDQDSDLVPDALDNCPRTPGPASNQGCPLEVRQLVIITPTHLELREKVYFASAKARILRRSDPLLAQVAEVLTHHPELTQVMIEGHTDSQGKAQANRVLSMNRAEAVRQALIQRGVEATRLLSVGHGPDRPVAPNTTSRGREQNRRVEFHLVHPPSPTVAFTQVSSK